MSDLTYNKLHWGDNSERSDELLAPANTAGEPVGELIAISYSTHKASEDKIWRHAFSKHPCEKENRSRGPYFLRLDSGGDYPVGTLSADTNAIGRAIDVELEGGTRIILSDCFVVTDPKGRTIWIASLQGVPYAIEQRAAGPMVTEHGIER